MELFKLLCVTFKLIAKMSNFTALFIMLEIPIKLF